MRDAKGAEHPVLPLLTPEQEAELRASTLVLREALQMLGRSRGDARFDDLVSRGNEVMTLAASRWDAIRDVPLDGYAYPSVHYAMQRELDRMNRREQANQLLEQACAHGYTFLNEHRDEGDTWKDSDADKLRRLKDYKAALVASLVAGHVGALLRAEGPEGALNRIHAKRAIQALYAALQALPNDRRVVELRYFEEKDWETTAQILGVSVATARRHHDEALLRLSVKLRAAGFKEAPILEDP